MKILTFEKNEKKKIKKNIFLKLCLKKSIIKIIYISNQFFFSLTFNLSYLTYIIARERPSFL